MEVAWNLFPDRFRTDSIWNHGVAKAMAKGSANLNDPKWQEANSNEVIEKVVADGKGKMKGLKDKLKPEEIKAIAAHVKTLK